MKFIKNIIRQKVTPRWSNLCARIGFAHRQNLVDNIRGLNVENPEQFIENLALSGALKWRFQSKVSDLSQLEAYMLSGRIDHQTMFDLTREVKNSYPERAEAFENMFNGVFKSELAIFPHLINKAAAGAFYLGAASAIIYSGTLFGPLFTSIIGAGTLYTFTSRILANRFRPDSAPGKFTKPGKGMFKWAFAAWTIALVVMTFQFIQERSQTRYENKKDISVTCKDTRVEATVCDKGECRTTDLITYRGENAHDRCVDSAENLRGTTKNQHLYQLPLEFTGNRINVRHRYAPTWVPDWAPYAVTDIVNLTGEGLSGIDRQARFIKYINNLWASGIMPSAREIAQSQLSELENTVIWLQFKDGKLKSYLRLASLHAQLENYNRAIQNADRVINFDLSVASGRPMFFDEAVFLKASVYRSQAMKHWNIRLMDNAMDLLISNEGRLRNEEDGYRVRYNFLMLQTCVLTEQLFPNAKWEHASSCTPNQIDGYLKNATFHYNLYTPMHKDNFMAVRSIIEYAKYMQAVKNPQAASKAYYRVLNLIDLIGGERPGYGPYLHTNDRWIGNIFGQSAGQHSYALRSGISKIFRGHLPPFSTNDQFDLKLFQVFRAQSYQGLAENDIRLARRDRENSRDHLLNAKYLLERAFHIMRGIQQHDVFKFFTGMFEEQQTYYSVLINYAEVLYQLGGTQNRTKAKRMAEEVRRQNSHSPNNITYLRSLQLTAQLELNLNNHRTALKLYRRILKGINQVRLPLEVDLPPHYLRLKTEAQSRISILQNYVK
jgi:tetratricopeptide (TPR) repeat protein